jgi:hypothetical protein
MSVTYAQLAYWRHIFQPHIRRFCTGRWGIRFSKVHYINNWPDWTLQGTNHSDCWGSSASLSVSLHPLPALNSGTLKWAHVPGCKHRARREGCSPLLQLVSALKYSSQWTQQNPLRIVMRLAGSTIMRVHPHEFQGWRFSVNIPKYSVNVTNRSTRSLGGKSSGNIRWVEGQRTYEVWNPTKSNSFPLLPYTSIATIDTYASAVEKWAELVDKIPLSQGEPNSSKHQLATIVLQLTYSLLAQPIYNINDRGIYACC